MKENVKIRGYFKIESFDKDGKLLDVFEQHNIVTDVARKSMAHLVAGIVQNNVINKFILGTKGHQGTDVLTPKTATEGFTSERKDLFCDTKVVDIDSWNKITFTPSGSLEDTKAKDVEDGATNSSTVDVIVDTSVTPSGSEEYSVTYVINIAQDAFNGNNNGVIYTEAGLWADDTLFAYRVFKGKIKESSSSLKITWTLIF